MWVFFPLQNELKIAGRHNTSLNVCFQKKYVYIYIKHSPVVIHL